MRNHRTDCVSPASTKAPLDVHLDKDLMNAATASAGKNHRSFDALVIRYETLIRNGLRRANVRSCDQDEVANSVLIKLWKIARDGKWDAARAKHSDDPFLPLLRRIIDSQAKDFFRGVSRRKTRMEKIAEAAHACGESWRTLLSPAPSSRGHGEAPDPSGVPEVLKDAVAALPEKLRLAFTLHAEGLSNRAIAAQTGYSWGQVSKQLKKARELLRKTVTLPE
jgi:RNA polymerase sigma factor (sigma-70 family)